MFNTLGLEPVVTHWGQRLLWGHVSVSHQGSVPQALGCVWSVDVVSTQAIKPGLFYSFTQILLPPGALEGHRL